MPQPTTENHKSSRFQFELAMNCFWLRLMDLNGGNLDTGGGKDLNKSC